jgi:hypothetical protein
MLYICSGSNRIRIRNQFQLIFFLRAHTYCSAHDPQRKREQRHVAEVESSLEKPIHPENKQCAYDHSKFEGFLLTSICSLFKTAFPFPGSTLRILTGKKNTFSCLKRKDFRSPHFPPFRLGT